MAKQTGKSGYITVQGGRIEVTKLSPKAKPSLVDSTDSGNYDPATDMLYEDNLVAKMGYEFAFEGNFYESTSPGIYALAHNNAPFAAQLFRNVNNKMYDGLWLLESCETEVSIRDPAMTNIKGTFKSCGIITVS